MYQRNEFPRPDFQRRNWQSLNGVWRFAFGEDVNVPQGICPKEEDFDREIVVPFCYQSKASGIEDLTYHEAVWYQKEFSLTEDLDGKEALLKFGAVDYVCHVWVNGIYVGKHEGGHVQFDFSIADYLQNGKNTITVKAEDDRTFDRPRGKQYWRDQPDRCWYTNTTGIWKSVWLEITGKVHIKHCRWTPDIDRRCVLAELFLNRPASGTAMFQIRYQNKVVKTLQASYTDTNYIREMIALTEEDAIDDLHLWSPENPNLYEVSIELLSQKSEKDQVETYFGMRKISIEHGKIMLNQHVLYQKLILDQGYWKDSLMTPPSEEAIVRDIMLTKEMGFQGARKHQKIEDSLYYYYADKMGLLVWAEMPSPYQFQAEALERTAREWQEAVTELYNHPSIVTWVIYNESWGVRNIVKDQQQQNAASALYYLTKALDPIRLISSNDGWEMISHTDICGLHDYYDEKETARARYQDFEEFLKTGVPHRQALANGHTWDGKPVILSEYGGIAFGEALQREDSWGYNQAAENEQEFLHRIAQVTEAITENPLFQGYCYTQLTDVQQEVNGLLDENHCPKTTAERLREIFER